MRIIIKSRYILLVFILLFILGVSCDEPINDIPIVTTYEADSISSNCVLLTGSVYEDTTILIIERGFCWSQSTNVSINDNKIDVSGSFGNFSYYLTNLNSNERYYSRAYAIGDNGTGYGELIEFTTPDHREKYTGTYYCTGEAHIWNESIPSDEYYNDTIYVTVSLDSTSNSMVLINDDLVLLDDEGSFSDTYYLNYHFYSVNFYSNDSINYGYATGGMGGGSSYSYKGIKMY